MARYIDITVDGSEVKDVVNRLKANMTAEQYERAMYGIFKRTGRHVAKILKKDLPQKYEVRPSEIGGSVKSPRLSMGFNGVGCSIPVVAPRGKIGSQYRASGGAHGWNSLKRKYRVKARVIKGAQSTLPEKWHTDYPPFRNLGSKLGKLTFARTSKARGPIMKVTGIAIPQMPMNRARTEVERDIKEFMVKQMEQRFTALMKVGR